jgi:CheY-like chemotaxis protein
VVDDDTLTRTLMKRLLTRLGCNVMTAENGQVALDLILGSGQAASGEEEVSLASGRFDVVFLDNQMPVLSGLRAVAKLRAMGREDFVVGVTGKWEHGCILTHVHNRRFSSLLQVTLSWEIKRNILKRVLISELYC